MENEFPLRIKQGLLVLIISIPIAVIVEIKNNNKEKNHIQIQIKDSLKINVTTFIVNRGSSLFNLKYYFRLYDDKNSTINWKKWYEIEEPFTLYKRAFSDTLYLIQPNEIPNKYYFILEDDKKDTIKRFGDMSLRELYESWKKNTKK